MGNFVTIASSFISHSFGIKMEEEIWKPVFLDGFETRFEVSQLGRVRTLFWGHRYIIMTPKIWEGYYKITLKFNKKCYSGRVNRLVAIAFVPNPLNLPEVNHLDFNKLNNRANNLQWSTKKQNAEHAGKGGRLSRGSRKLPPKPIGKYIGEILVKEYQSMGKLKEDGYPRISVSRAAEKGKEYKGYLWKYL